MPIADSLPGGGRLARAAAIAVVLAVSLLAAACTNGSSPGAPEAEPAVSTGLGSIIIRPDSESSPDQPEPDQQEPDQPNEVEALSGNYGVAVISQRPHDPTAYTQGLELHQDRLLESTGTFGQSQRRWLDPLSGEVLLSVDLDETLFGEGITVVDGEVLQLTWKAEQLIRSQPESLSVISTSSYSGEGWGLCFNGTELVMSNGTSQITFRDQTTFEPTRVINVTDANGAPINSLNELECVGDQIVANIYTSDQIVVIDADGSLAATIDASSLRPDNAPANDANYALNGIAFDAETGHYLITGKWWDVLYEVAFIKL